VVPKTLSSEQKNRYSRHLLVPEVGEAGQQKLLAAKVLLVGAGGLGSPAGLYLAAAGVGTLGVLDSDVVDLSNLQRQVLHTTQSVGRPKTESAEATLRALNPDVRVVRHDQRLEAANVMEVIAPYDVIVDGCDNFSTKYLVNDAAVLTGKTNVYGSIFRFDGQASTFVPKAGPCYRCLYPEPTPSELAPSCDEAGVLGVLPGVIGIIQATEAIKSILGKGELLSGRLLTYDALAMTFRQFKVRRDPKCAVCGDAPTIQTPSDLVWSCHFEPRVEAPVR
jgi:molybdopterin/thiamine biosynthesis adenylyltransferase